MARHEGGWIGSRLEMVELGETPPPLVCRKECPIDIVPFDRIGPVRLGDPLAKHPPFPEYQPYPKEIRVSGVYALDSDERKTISGITVNVFDFPDRCLRAGGLLLARTGSLEDWTESFGDCKCGHDHMVGDWCTCERETVVIGSSFEDGFSLKVRR
jgi:hypothetical protein